MDLQEIFTLAIVVIAAIFLGRYLWHEVRGSSGGTCGGCGGCGKPAARPSRLITLRSGAKDTRRKASTRDR